MVFLHGAYRTLYLGFMLFFTGSEVRFYVGKPLASEKIIGDNKREER
jgi:hypothetical protein